MTPATSEHLLAFLEQLQITTVTIEHPPLFTVEQSRQLRGDIPGAHTKNLFLADRKHRLFLVVAEEGTAIDLKQLHNRIGAAGRVSFGKPDLMLATLGVAPGSVTPFAAINDTAQRVTVVLDAALMQRDPLNFHPLVNTKTTRIAAGDLLRFLQATNHTPQIVAVSGGEAAATP